MQWKIYMTVLALFCAVSGLNGVPPQRQVGIESNIAAASAAIKSLECDFTQEKEVSMLSTVMKSSGKLYFVNDGRLRWEYTEPYRYSFVMNGDRIKVASESNSSVIDTRSSKQFRRISEVIAGGIDGSAITDRENFAITFSEEDGEVVVDMKPLKKDMKGFFNGIRLYFPVSDWMVRKIVLSEPTGDSSEITIRNRKLNGPIDDKVFDID